MKTLLMFIWLTVCIKSLVPYSTLANEDDIIWRKVEHTEVIDHVIFSPNGIIIASEGDDRRILLWDVENGEIVRELENNPPVGIFHIKYSLDGRYIAATMADSTIRLWEAETGELFRTFEGLLGSARAVAFAPDNRTIAIVSVKSGRGQLLTYDIESGEVLDEFGDEGQPPSASAELVYSPDGSTLLQGGTSVLLWDVATGQRKQESLWAGNDNVHHIAISNNGEYLAAASRGNKNIYIYRKIDESWQFQRFFGAEFDPISGLDITPNGAFVVSSALLLRIWEVETGENVYTYTLPHDFYSFNAIQIAPDSMTIVTASSKREVILFRSRWTGASDVPDSGEGQQNFSIGSLFPHPIQPPHRATLPINIFAAGIYRLHLYSLAGEFVAEIHNAYLEAGTHNMELDFAPYNLAAGSYYLIVTNGVHNSELSVIIE